MVNKRENWIDWSKTILIYLVIVGHAGIYTESTQISYIIRAFHMPAFFVIAGYLHKSQNSFYQLLKNNFKRLIVPTLFFSVVIWLYNFLKIIAGIEGIDSKLQSLSFTDLILKPLLGLVIYDKSIATPMFKVSWFLIILFLLKIACYYLLKLNKNWVLFVIILCVVCSYFIKDYGRDNLWFFPQRFVVCLPFYIFGFLLKTKLNNTIQYNTIQLLLASIVLGLVLIMLSAFNGECDISWFLFGKSIILYYLTAVIGTLFVFSISLMFNKITNKFVYVISISTVTILGLHLIVLEIVKNVSPIVESFIVAFVTLIVLYPICLFLNKYLPYCVGMKK